MKAIYGHLGKHTLRDYVHSLDLKTSGLSKVLRLAANMGVSLFGPWELTNRKGNKRIALVPQCCNRIIPPKESCSKTKPTPSLDEIFISTFVIADCKEHKVHGKSEEEAKECNRGADGGDRQEPCKNKPAY